MYAGDKDIDRLSKDLSVKDLERLIRKISSLSKKDAIPTSCRVEPYSGTNALPKVIYFFTLPNLTLSTSILLVVDLSFPRAEASIYILSSSPS
jgi:hypothetical protein